MRCMHVVRVTDVYRRNPSPPFRVRSLLTGRVSLGPPWCVTLGYRNTNRITTTCVRGVF